MSTSVFESADDTGAGTIVEILMELNNLDSY